MGIPISMEIPISIIIIKGMPHVGAQPLPRFVPFGAVVAAGL